MNFNSLNQTEKLAVYGAVGSVVGAVVASFLAGLLWLTLLAGIAMLAVVFLPQLSPQTNLPGSRGSLMLAAGAVGALGAVLALLVALTALGSWLGFWPIQTLFLLVGVAGGLLMGWAGWQAFQAEGGKFEIGQRPPNA